ncbi:ABC transporter permease [Mucilaginibacter rubeus]|jgi:putative ABC transport system permease protein|uniref:ABC transporter permease n=1 Tax=Mucilaginibacter rubeus TaxID=2027860 RepID=UPI00166A1D9B|nr:ABC transporter permease [Mucilaginibacter rubeus]GGA89542.1 ABC transporter permease [Mucilaginibacter rubeus]
MLKNYLKIAIAVLKRRKFFTFISLFGISFTLTILMVVTSFADKMFGPNYPDNKRDRSLYVIEHEEFDDKTQGMNKGPMSFYFLNHYAASMKTPAKVAISSMFTFTNTYVNNKKISISLKFANADYWDVLDYQFLEGRPFTKQQIDNAEKVAVISEDTRRDYFGDIPSVVGKYIEADNVKYRVLGVVKDVPATLFTLYADIYLPYTVSKNDYRNKDFGGNYSAILMGNSKDDLPKMKSEFANVISRISMKDKQFNHLYCYADSYFNTLVRTMAGRKENSGMATFVVIISIFVFLFLLLPTLNLVNINITRIMERSSEIGVRKAFGASSKTLVYQFIIENIILTFLGGLIGVVLSVIVIKIINGANLIAHLELTLNFTVLFYSLLTCIFFGLLSGVYPAWRMSRLNVVTALKA